MGTMGIGRKKKFREWEKGNENQEKSIPQNTTFRTVRSCFTFSIPPKIALIGFHCSIIDRSVFRQI